MNFREFLLLAMDRQELVLFVVIAFVKACAHDFLKFERT